MMISNQRDENAASQTILKRNESQDENHQLNEKQRSNPPLWNNPILYLINIHILIALHAFSWWALAQSEDHPLRKHIITQPLSFIHKTITTIPETIMIPTINNHNISVIISEYFPSDETVICTSFLAGPFLAL